jgi:hypothetical protein
LITRISLVSGTKQGVCTENGVRCSWRCYRPQLMTDIETVLRSASSFLYIHTHSLVTAINGTYKHNSALPCLFIFGSDSTAPFLLQTHVAVRHTLLNHMPWSLVEIKRCSEQPTALCRGDNAVPFWHRVTRSVARSCSVPISIPCLSRRFILLFRRQPLRFLRNAGQSLPGYTSLHAGRRCCYLLSFVSVVQTNIRDGKRMWQKIGNEMKTGGDFALEF